MSFGSSPARTFLEVLIGTHTVATELEATDVPDLSVIVLAALVWYTTIDDVKADHVAMQKERIRY